MNLNDWYDTGERILDAVQNAVDTQDFSGLSSELGSIFGLNNNTSYSRQGAYGGAGQARGTNNRPVRSGGADNRNRTARSGGPYNQPGRMGGILMAVAGYGLAAFFALCLLAVRAVSWYFWVRTGVTSTVLFALMAASLALGIMGSRKWSLAARFGRYSQILGRRTFCQIIEISSVVGRSEKSVVRDLKAMIKKGYFPQGHIDKKKTCFITDNATYQQYLLAQQSYEERENEAKKASRKGRKAKDAAPEEAAAPDGKVQEKELDPGVRELVEEGRRYIRHIRECNDRIPGEEMTDKLYKLERVTARIFAEAERNPSVAGDLKKMMNYYLPTLSKLLDAYCELDAQPVQGTNIVGTKREIEQSIDTINEAFANLLDSLFEDTAWDISSDISVLNTMLAQEGLTGGAFDKDKAKV